MNMKNSPILAALLLTLTACGGNSGSEPAPAPVAGALVFEPIDNQIELSDDPVTPVPVPATPINQQQNEQQTVQQAEQQVVQQPVPEPEPTPATPVTPVQETPAEAEPAVPAVAEPEPPQTVDTDPVTEEPASQPLREQLVATGDCAAPAAGSTVTSQTTPVKANDNPFFYPAMGPQCVSPASQFDGPGLAYGDFLLSNNAWNGQTSTWDWQQCIALTESSNGSILPSWTFDWGNEDDLQPGLFEWEVKTYPEIIYGYKSNDEISAPCSSTGLPVKVSNLPDYTIDYSYQAPITNNRIGDLGDENNNPSMVTGGDRNVAIESFFHTSCDIQRGASSNMELELMVWLESGAERLPSGQPPIAQFTSSAGQTYDVYTKSNNYVAYLAQNPVRTGSLNWSEFIDDATTNASTYSVKTLQSDWCMANIIFGSEIWWGEGSVSLDHYQISRSY